MSDKIDYTAVIAALEDEKAQAIAQFDMAITMMRQLAARPPAASANGGARQMPLVDDGEAPQPARPYVGMSVTKGAEAYLRAIGRPRTTVDIARALERGGLEHKSSKFNNTVYSRLYRAKAFGRKGDKWALKEWKEHREAQTG